MGKHIGNRRVKLKFWICESFQVTDSDIGQHSSHVVESHQKIYDICMKGYLHIVSQSPGLLLLFNFRSTISRDSSRHRLLTIPAAMISLTSAGSISSTSVKV